MKTLFSVTSLRLWLIALVSAFALPSCITVSFDGGGRSGPGCGPSRMGGQPMRRPARRPQGHGEGHLTQGPRVHYHYERGGGWTRDGQRVPTSAVPLHVRQAMADDMREKGLSLPPGLLTPSASVEQYNNRSGGYDDGGVEEVRSVRSSRSSRGGVREVRAAAPLNTTPSWEIQGQHGGRYIPTIPPGMMAGDYARRNDGRYR